MSVSHLNINNKLKVVKRIYRSLALLAVHAGAATVSHLFSVFALCDPAQVFASSQFDLRVARVKLVAAILVVEPALVSVVAIESRRAEGFTRGVRSVEQHGSLLLDQVGVLIG